MQRARFRVLASAGAAILLLQACASESTPGTSGLPALDKLPSLPILPSLAGTEEISGSPTEVYTSIARGVLTCWFGATGPLKQDYIYHADADPPSKGGASEIAIRTRDREAADPRSLRAFRIGIAPGAERTHVEVENSTLPEPLAEHLKADVVRWAAGNEGCGEPAMTAGWSTSDSTKAPPLAKPAVQKTAKKP